MLNKKTLPIEGLLGATFYATLLISLLVVIGHPVEELAVTSAVLYAFLWATAEGIVRLLLRVLEGLIRYGETVSQKLGFDIEDMAHQAPAGTFFGKLLASIMVGLMVSAIVGSALVLGQYATVAVGLTQLPGPLSWIAWGLAGAGLAGLAFILTLMALSLRTVDNLSEADSSRFSQFHGATREVDFRLRRAKLVPAFPIPHS